MDRILNEIKGEDNKNPYTDQDLAQRLNLSRAEVISFRKKHNIPDSDMLNQGFEENTRK